MVLSGDPAVTAGKLVTRITRGAVNVENPVVATIQWMEMSQSRLRLGGKLMRQSAGKTYQHCLLVVLAAAVVTPAIANAHQPDRETQSPHQRIDVIGPLGNRFPPSYRRVYNRPTYLGGKIAYLIAPSSQEAMAWHKAEHIGAYKNHLPRIENTYFYPKPWEAMRVGQRVSVLEAGKKTASQMNDGPSLDDDGMISPVISEPIPSQVETLETTDLPMGNLEVEPGKK